MYVSINALTKLVEAFVIANKLIEFNLVLIKYSRLELCYFHFFGVMNELNIALLCAIITYLVYTYMLWMYSKEYISTDNIHLPVSP